MIKTLILKSQDYVDLEHQIQAALSSVVTMSHEVVNCWAQGDWHYCLIVFYKED